MDLNYLLFLQELRNSLPEGVAIFLKLMSDLVVSPLFIIIPCILFWCIDKRRATVVLFSFSIGVLVNELLKTTFCTLRPWVRDARIEPYGDAKLTATGYSFPSGHVQAATSIVGTIGWAYRDKSRWTVPLAAILVLLVAFSRNFLGVHTPQDVVVSLVVSFLVVLLAERVVSWVEEEEGRDAKLTAAAIAFGLLGLAYIAFKPYPELPAEMPDGVTVSELINDSFQACGYFLGCFASWLAERRLVGFKTGCDLKQGVIRVIIGIVLTLLFHSLLPIPVEHLFGEAAFEFCKAFFTIFAVVFLTPWAFTKVEKAGEKNG